MGAFAHGVNPALIPLGYDLRELKPVVQLTTVPTVLTAVVTAQARRQREGWAMPRQQLPAPPLHCPWRPRS